jgi:hypothetical protein
MSINDKTRSNAQYVKIPAVWKSLCHFWFILQDIWMLKITNEHSFNMNFLSMSSVSPMGDHKMVGTINEIICNPFHLDIHAARNLKPEVGAISVRTL